MNQRRYKPTLDREQRLLLPERVEDYVGENHQIRALDAYVDTLDLAALGFKHTETGTVAGQPPYNPWALLKLYLFLLRPRDVCGFSLWQASSVSVFPQAMKFSPE